MIFKGKVWINLYSQITTSNLFHNVDINNCCNVYVISLLHLYFCVLLTVLLLNMLHSWHNFLVTFSVFLLLMYSACSCYLIIKFRGIGLVHEMKQSNSKKTLERLRNRPFLEKINNQYSKQLIIINLSSDLLSIFWQLRSYFWEETQVAMAKLFENAIKKSLRNGWIGPIKNPKLILETSMSSPNRLCKGCKSALCGVRKVRDRSKALKTRTIYTGLNKHHKS